MCLFEAVMSSLYSTCFPIMHGRNHPPELGKVQLHLLILLVTFSSGTVHDMRFMNLRIENFRCHAVCLSRGNTPANITKRTTETVATGS